MEEDDIVQSEIPLIERAKLEEYEKNISKLEETKKKFEEMTLDSAANIAEFKGRIQEVYNAYQHHLTEMSVDIIDLFENNPRAQKWFFPFFNKINKKRLMKNTVFTDFIPWELTTTDWINRDNQLVPLLAKYIIYSSFLLENYWMALEKMCNRIAPEIKKPVELALEEYERQKAMNPNITMKDIAPKYNTTANYMMVYKSENKEKEQSIAIKT